MRRLMRIVLGVLGGVVLLAVIALAGMRTWSLLRETTDFRTAAGPGAAFAQVDGLSMHYRSWGPENGRPLMLVHGSLAWSETFRDIATPLAARGYRVIAPDMPPFGFSQRPSDHDYSRAAQAKRILAFADALGLERFAVAVHSYGGGSAIEAALTAPQRIEALVLLDVALGLGQTGTPSPPLAPLLDLPVAGDALVAATFANPMLIGFGLRDFIHDDSLVTDARIALYAQPSVVAGTTEAVRRWLFTGLYGNERAAMSSDTARWQAFERPVLVIWGREDTVTPLAQGEAIAAAFPRATLEVLDGVNHIPHVENPGGVEQLIARFLDAHPGGGEGPVVAPKMPRLRGSAAN